MKESIMPVAPNTTDAFVNGSNLVDIIISQIDYVLSSPAEKYYRHGADEDYFYTFAFAIGHLDDNEMNALKHAYANVGWGNIQVRNLLEPGLATKVVVVRIFRNENSDFSRWETK